LKGPILQEQEKKKSCNKEKKKLRDHYIFKSNNMTKDVCLSKSVLASDMVEFVKME